MLQSETPLPVSTLHRTTGLLGAGLCSVYILFLSLARQNPGFAVQSSRIQPANLISLGVLALLFLLSISRKKLAFIQPIILLVMTPMPMMVSWASMFSLGHFLGSCILLDRMGFFRSGHIAKSVLLVGYYLVCETLLGLSIKAHPAEILLPVAFVIVAVIFLFRISRERLVIYRETPKPELSLARLGITKKEAEYLRGFLTGSSIKEVASDKGVSESTVRNTMSRIYRKFGVPDKSGLLAKCENFSIVD